MSKMSSVLLILLLWTGSAVLASSLSTEHTLVIDEAVPENISLEFSEDEDRLEPKISEFKIVSTLLMSNEIGERWATITLKNLSAQQRLLDHEHLVALFANGEKKHPLSIQQKFSGREVITIVVNFGQNKFPILKVTTRN